MTYSTLKWRLASISLSCDEPVPKQQMKGRLIHLNWNQCAAIIQLFMSQTRTVLLKWTVTTFLFSDQLWRWHGHCRSVFIVSLGKMSWNISHFVDTLPLNFDSWNVSSRLDYYADKLYGFGRLDVTDQAFIAERWVIILVLENRTEKFIYDLIKSIK